MALMPHKRKQPDPDTSSDTDTGSLAPRVLVRRKVNGGRALNGPEGWFPGADIPYETMRKFEGAAKGSKPPASEADLKIARKAVEDAWRSLDKDGFDPRGCRRSSSDRGLPRSQAHEWPI